VLTDQDGRQVTERDLSGKPGAIFCGFTSCPDICPTTLLDLTDWLKELGPDADKLNIAFVSAKQVRAHAKRAAQQVRGRSLFAA